MYEGRILGAYSSWDTCEEQVNHYPRNSYKGLKTRQQEVDAYSKFVHKHTSNVEVGKAPQQLGLFQIKNLIIIVQFVEI